MSQKSWVRKLMLSLSDYATVSEDGTLRDALRALSEAQKKVRPGAAPHRALLVEREPGVFVGKLGYQAILGALRPPQASVCLDGSMRRAGVSDDMVERSMESLDMFVQDEPSLRRRAESLHIRDLLLPEPRVIDADVSVPELLGAFVDCQSHSLLVVEKGDVIGVIRVADVFDEVARVALGASEEEG